MNRLLHCLRVATFAAGTLVTTEFHLATVTEGVLRYAARDADKPVADLPAGFAVQLKAMGYE